MSIHQSFALLPRITHSAGRLWLDRLSQNNRPFYHPEQISPQWLEQQFAGQGTLLSIDSLNWQAVHSGTTRRSLITINTLSASSQFIKPLFVKTPPPEFALHLFGVLFQLGFNELGFYRQIAPLLTIPTPDCRLAAGNNRHYLLLLEQLDADKTQFIDVSGRCSFAQATQVMDALAELHASLWQSPLFDNELSWVERYENSTHHALLDLIRRAAVKRVLTHHKELLPEEVQRAIPLIMQRYDALERCWVQGPRTLLHGDAHIGNMYFSEHRAGLLDWQVIRYGQAMRDVSYFLINSVPTELRREKQASLIHHYLQQLSDEGISLHFDQAWEQYRLHSFYAWVAAMVTVAGAGLQDSEIASSGLRRSCQALLDLNAIALLKSIPSLV